MSSVIAKMIQHKVILDLNPENSFTGTPRWRNLDLHKDGKWHCSYQGVLDEVQMEEVRANFEVTENPIAAEMEEAIRLAGAEPEDDALLTVPDHFQLWIYDGEGNYRPQVVLVLAEAEKVRKAGRGYREFRRRLGNYASGKKGVMKDQTNLWVGTILADSPSTPERILELRNECVKVCKFLWELSKQQ